MFNKHSQIEKSAIVLKENFGPVLCIQRLDGKTKVPQKSLDLFEQEFIQIAQTHELTSGISSFKFFESLPVDVRHNIKIDRLKLASIINNEESL